MAGLVIRKIFKYNRGESLMKQVSIARCENYNTDLVSESLDSLLISLGMDGENPFGAFIKPGMRVTIKPNWVASRWRKSCNHVDDLYCVITHPAVIEAVADRVAMALEGKGEIIIADNPSIDADFEELMEFTNIRRLENKYNVPCHIYDLRPLVCPSLDVYGKKDKMVEAFGDPNGQIEINLGEKSLLCDVDSKLFRGVFDEREETVASHTGETQLYTMARSIYDADVFISIPKLKTHQKVGATLNLKGLVGSITKKNQLVHWRIGTPETGGDEYPDKESYDRAYASGILHRGSWPGNDTIWRMVVDLYKTLITNEHQKRFTVIDGIMGGEGQGPFCPNSKMSKTLICSDDFLAADIVAVRDMGLNPHKIKYLSYFMDEWNIDIDNDIAVTLNGNIKRDYFSSVSAYEDFKVIDAWKDIKIH